MIREETPRGPSAERALVAERITAQLLAGPPAATPEQVVDRLLAVQAQDLRGARLAVRARSVGLTSGDVDAALTERRTLVVGWLNRGTLHLVRAEDYWWLHPLTAPRTLPGVTRRLAQLELTPGQAERAVAVVLAELGDGPRSRSELRAALEGAGLPTDGQRLVHLLAFAALREHVVRGPMRDGDQLWVAAESWLGPAPAALSRPEALARLARRYLAGHGPADARDLAKWAGIALGDARSGLARAAAGLKPAGDPDHSELVDLTGREQPAPLPAPRLLGPFDPLLHGWVSRLPVTGPHEGIVTTNGLFRPFALVDGRAVAIWTLNGGRLTIRPLEPVDDEDLKILLSDALAVQRFLGMPERPAAVEG